MPEASCRCETGGEFMGMQRNTIAQSFDDTKLLAEYSGSNAVSPFLQKQER